MFCESSQAQTEQSNLPDHLQKLLNKGINSKYEIIISLKIKNNKLFIFYTANITSSLSFFTTPSLTFLKHGIGAEDLCIIRNHFASRSFPGFLSGLNIQINQCFI